MLLVHKQKESHLVTFFDSSNTWKVKRVKGLNMESLYSIT